MKKMLTIMSNIFFMAFCRIFSLYVAKTRNVCFLGRFAADVAVFAETRNGAAVEQSTGYATSTHARDIYVIRATICSESIMHKN